MNVLCYISSQWQVRVWHDDVMFCRWSCDTLDLLLYILLWLTPSVINSSPWKRHNITDDPLPPSAGREKNGSSTFGTTENWENQTSGCPTSATTRWVFALHHTSLPVALWMNSCFLLIQCLPAILPPADSHQTVHTFIFSLFKSEWSKIMNCNWYRR